MKLFWKKGPETIKEDNTPKVIISNAEVNKNNPLFVSDYLLERAEKENGKLYGIVDSARNDEVFRYLITDNVQYKSLFEGTKDVRSFGVSGFMVECKKESPLFQWMTSEAWGDSCSIFFTSRASFDELFQHFQKFNRVYLEDEDVVLFRYYDPRVLRVYLPTCNGNEIELFFGEVESFFVENEDPKLITIFKKEISDEIIKNSTKTNSLQNIYLKIKKEQIEVFKQVAMGRFINEMINHVKTHFPNKIENSTGLKLKDRIKATIEKAKKYDLVTERDICKFINLTMIYGIDFGINKETKWLHNFLINKEESNPTVRLNECYKEAIKQLENEEAII